MAQLRGGRFQLDRLVDMKHIPELSQLSCSEGAGLTLGAAVPCYRIYEDQTIARLYPGLVDAASLIGGIQIQGRASVGGNLCNSAPSADMVPALIALEAACEIAGPGGHRTVAVEDFCTGPGSNVLQGGEVLVALKLPPPSPTSGAHFLRFIPRNEMDIAIVGAGASVVLEDDRRHIRSARIALGAVAPHARSGQGGRRTSSRQGGQRGLHRGGCRGCQDLRPTHQRHARHHPAKSPPGGSPDQKSPTHRH